MPWPHTDELAESLVPAKVLWTNRMLLGGIAAELALLMLLIYVPPLRTVFSLAPIPPVLWLLRLTFGPVLLLLEEGRKALRRLG